MRSLSTALQNLLTGATNNIPREDLYEFYHPIHGYARYTTAGIADLSWNALTWSHGLVGFERSKVVQVLGTETDQMDLTVHHYGAAYGSSALTWHQMAIYGFLDGLQVKVYLAFYDGSGAFVDAALLTGGYVGPCDPDSTSVRMVVDSPWAKLKGRWPRAAMTAGCPWNLYDGNCGLTRPTTWDARTTAASSDTKIVKVASLTVAADFFNGGYVQFVSGSGALLGQARAIYDTVQNGANLDLYVAPALPSIPGSGYTVKIVQGCDKKAATCSTKFANTVHFGGVPFMPSKQPG